jgi:hypothetical protein
MAIQGLIVATYDKSFEGISTLMDDVDSCELLLRVRAEVQTILNLAGPCFLAGHSRGAKVSQVVPYRNRDTAVTMPILCLPSCHVIIQCRTHASV